MSKPRGQKPSRLSLAASKLPATSRQYPPRGDGKEQSQKQRNMNSESTVPPQASETLWYYADANNQPVGPLSMAALQRLAASGVISPNAHVIENGGSVWRTFAEVAPKTPPVDKPASLWRTARHGREAEMPSREVPQIQGNASGVNRIFAAGGGCIGIAGSFIFLILGALSCATIVGAIFGIPMILTAGALFAASGRGIAWATNPDSFVKGNCPYCGHEKIEARTFSPGIDCPACKKRIVIRDKVFTKVS